MNKTLLVMMVACGWMAGCGDGFSVPTRDDGGNIICSALSVSQCGDHAECSVRPGCCGGPSTCGDAGAVAITCQCPQPCAQLDEATCKTRSDCTADYCANCTCTPGFQSCRALTAAAVSCPALGCPQPICPDRCHTSTDCTQNGGYCNAPGTPICGGACLIPPSCNTDTDCTALHDATWICDKPACPCTQDNTCVQGCSSANPCPEGQTCGNDHRCTAQRCGQGSAGCPTNFDCSPTDSGKCFRRVCTGEAQCPGASCVNGYCYSALGMCELPRP